MKPDMFADRWWSGRQDNSRSFEYRRPFRDSLWDGNSIVGYQRKAGGRLIPPSGTLLDKSEESVCSKNWTALAIA